MFSKFKLKISRKVIIIGGILFLTCLLGGIYAYNQFYKQDWVNIEVTRGVATKISNGQKQVLPARGQRISPGDTIELSPNTLVALIFHDGSILTFGDNETIKYDFFKSEEQHNQFNFINLSKNTSFQYVTQTYQSKVGAVILGRENSQENLSHSKVLGATDKKLTDENKIEIWGKLNQCIQNNENKLSYSEKFKTCLQSQNLDTLDSLNP